jgi:hypothetical protein
VSEIGEELRATLEARREVGKELEPELVERFVDRLEQEMDRRIDERLAQRSRHRGPAATMSSTGMALGSLALAIPLLGVAGGTAGFPGILMVCLAIVLVNAMWAYRR